MGRHATPLPWPRGVLALAIAASVALIWPPARAERLDPEPRLREILRELARVDAFYQDNALRFTCDERVIHSTDRGDRSFRYKYIFVYDDDGQLSDHRVPQGRTRDERADYTVVDRAYTWISIFQPAKWGVSYRYLLGGEAKVLDRPAMAVRFEPLPPYLPEYNEWYGTAWVDVESHQLLRVEALKVSDHLRQQSFEQSLRDAAQAAGTHQSSHLIERYLTDYTVERNGIRFPTEVTIERSRFQVWGRNGNSGYREYPVLRIRQLYDNYRFFGVQTREEIRGAAD